MTELQHCALGMIVYALLLVVDVERQGSSKRVLFVTVHLAFSKAIPYF